MGLLASEQQLGVREIAASVRACHNTVRCWLKRDAAQGSDGLQEQWAGGAPAQVTPAYQEQVLHLVRRRPRSLNLPSCTWTLHRLADGLAQRTGSRVQQATGRAPLLAAAIVWSRPHQTSSSPAPEYAVQKRRWRQPATIGRRAMASPPPTRSTAVGSPRCGRGGAPRASRCCFPRRLSRPRTTASAPSPRTRENRWSSSSGTRAAKSARTCWKRVWTHPPPEPARALGILRARLRMMRARAWYGQQRDGWSDCPCPPRARGAAR